MKTFIIHTTEKATQLLEELNTCAKYTEHYDGGEMTVGKGSTRYYYYDVTHANLTIMVRHLQQVKRELDIAVKVKIFNGRHGGNFNFD